MKVDALHSIPAEATETAAGQRLSVRVEGLRLDAQVGVYASEHGRTQPLEISLQAEVEEASAAPGSDLTQAVNYAAMAETVRQVVAARHHELLEDLAQTLTDTLFQDVRVKRLRLTIDKPDALDDARSVGVTYERWR
ncbi:7,8-dihydroneopterin aldolase [Marinicauda pacifica]|jgi:7,8-dihydroneopterin aldolase/epimerase/oxygenase|uniref:7,8-dihydroneopterin aldolase n=1 Tax=Marinicauda pacifica TaxID=1133559 RepID=A0A4S2HD38_9PROT|nr:MULTISPECIES: dihydroneopterin aldolase [Marinicauda]TGY93967.1 dihydroneopterin aldolase [Marinicauda pacifica]GGE31781.1 7,8-dihydroneopterin aldolase [Marinicauda pacifica]